MPDGTPTDTVTPAEPAPVDTPTADADVTATDTPTDYAAEAERWKQLARKHEDRAKANANAAKQLEDLKRQSMTEMERAVDEARAAGRAEALREVGTSRVEDAFRVAAAGRTVDLDALLEGLDLARFLDDDGQPQREAIQKWIDRIAPAAEPPDPNAPPRVPPLGQGTRSGQQIGIGNDDALTKAVKSRVGLA